MPESARPIRLATRRSDLAMAQARQVGEALGGPYELVGLTTRGDAAAGPLHAVGGKGLFTAELEASLREGRVDLAVHSAKDVPAELPGDMTIAAVPLRADPRDAMVAPAPLEALPDGSRIGTSSPRRTAQVLAVRADLRIEPVRGNVETRLARVGEELDGVVVAMAGLERLGIVADLAGRLWPLEVEDFVPAAGQGALIVQCLTEDRAMRDRAGTIDDADSSAALSAERHVVRALGATCRSAIGVHADRAGGAWRAMGLAAAPDGSRVIRCDAAGPSARAAGEALLAHLEARGARDLLASGG